MNKPNNYSAYADMPPATAEYFEPYGISMPPAHVAETDGFKAYLYLHRDAWCEEPREE